MPEEKFIASAELEDNISVRLTEIQAALEKVTQSTVTWASQMAAQVTRLEESFSRLGVTAQSASRNVTQAQETSARQFFLPPEERQRYQNAIQSSQQWREANVLPQWWHATDAGRAERARMDARVASRPTQTSTVITPISGEREQSILAGVPADFYRNPDKYPQILQKLAAAGVDVSVSQDKLAASTTKVDTATKQSQGNMLRMSFALFGVALAYQSVAREIERVTGEKLPPYIKGIGDALNITSDLALTGSVVGGALGAGGAGLVIGAGIGATIGAIGLLSARTPEIIALNDALEALGKKDLTVAGLMQVTGWTEKMALQALEAAKNYDAVRRALMDLKGLEPPTRLERLFTATSYEDLDLPDAEYIKKYRDQDKEMGLRRAADTALTKAILRQPYEAMDRQIGMYANQEQPAQGLAKATDWKTQYAKGVLQTAQLDPTFAKQLQEGTAKLAEYNDQIQMGAYYHRNTAQAEAERTALIADLTQKADAAAAALEKLKFPDLQISRLTPFQEQRVDAATQTLAQDYIATLKVAGKDTAALEEQWNKVEIAERRADGTIRIIHGSMAALRSQAIAIQDDFQIRVPAIQRTQLTPQEINETKQRAIGFANKELDLIQNSNLPLEQKQQMLEKINEDWRSISLAVGDTHDNLQLLLGPAAAFFGLANQTRQALKPNIQMVPELNAGYASSLQKNLVQAEGLFSKLGVKQEPQEYLLFGQGGKLYKYVTSSEAMTLAMQLLQEEIGRNTDEQKTSNALRGHYNIPTAFGYKPPTPWEYYAKTGAGDMGPVNYPWMFKDKGAVDASGKPMIGSIATGITETYPTTLSLDKNTIALGNQTDATKRLAAILDQYSKAQPTALTETVTAKAKLDAYNKRLYDLNEFYYPSPKGGGGSSGNLAPGGLRGMADAFSQQYGMGDLNVLRAIIQAESNWNPNAVGDQGSSIGLLQNNMKGGRGSGYTKQQLLDPNFNVQLGMGEISQWYQRGVEKGLSGAALATYVGKYAQRPAAGFEQNYARAYEQLGGSTGYGGPVKVTGMESVSAASNIIATRTTTLANQTAPGLSRIATGIASSNALLVQMVARLTQIASLVGKPPQVNVYGTAGVTVGAASPKIAQVSQSGFASGMSSANRSHLQ